MTIFVWGWLWVTLLGMAFIVMVQFGRVVKDSLDSAERLRVTAQKIDSSLDVIIPAFNESDKIKTCVTAVLASCDPLTVPVHIWVADDQSTDETLAIAQTLAQQDNRVRVFSVPHQTH